MAGRSGVTPEHWPRRGTKFAGAHLTGFRRAAPRSASLRASLEAAGRPRSEGRSSSSCNPRAHRPAATDRAAERQITQVVPKCGKACDGLTADAEGRYTIGDALSPRARSRGSCCVASEAFRALAPRVLAGTHRRRRWPPWRILGRLWGTSPNAGAGERHAAGSLRSWWKTASTLFPSGSMTNAA